MTHRNYYAEAIEILARPHKAEELLIVMAKARPSLLVWAHEQVSGGGALNALIDRILPTCRGKIDAIKELRGKTGLGLKESKDAVERRMAETGFEFP